MTESGEPAGLGEAETDLLISRLISKGLVVLIILTIVSVIQMVRLGVSDRYISHLIPLAFLSPEIVGSILAGAQPTDLTAETLTKRIEIPLAWSEQVKLLGFP